MCSGTCEDYRLLENMNKLTSLKYMEMKDISINISRNLQDLNNKCEWDTLSAQKPLLFLLFLVHICFFYYYGMNIWLVCTFALDASLQPYLDQINQIEEQVSSLEQAAYKLDAYSKKLGKTCSVHSYWLSLINNSMCSILQHASFTIIGECLCAGCFVWYVTDQ